MQIKSVKLSNIRSYTDCHVEFPSGSVLLSGDIGTGKSTILLAVEFALFGIKRGELPGTALLRHDKKQGSVELKIEVSGKDIIVVRNLKRGSDDVKQDSGYVIVDGVKKEMSPVELKSFVLKVLGYPMDLVSKSKDLIYRYTVYTPQEEMKQILFEDREVRLDTLRKVFNIDKYKRVKENALIFTRHLKEKVKKLEGQISDIEDKKKQLNGYEKEFLESKIKMDGLTPKLKDSKSKVALKKKDIESVEESIKSLQEIKKEFQICEVNIRNNEDQLKGNSVKITQIEKQLADLKKEVEGKDVDTEIIPKIEEELKEKEGKVERLEKAVIAVNGKISEFNTRKSQASETKNKISKLNVCPLCKQDVVEGHKKSIIDEADKECSAFDSQIVEYNEKLKKGQEAILRIKKDIYELRNKQKESSLILLKLKNIQEKEGMIADYLPVQDKLKEDVSRLKINQSDLKVRIDAKKDVGDEYHKLKKELDIALGEERDIEVKIASLKRGHEDLGKIIEIVKKEIDNKEAARKKLLSSMELINWLDKGFVKLVDTIEKHVMGRVHGEFNQFFTDWFNILIEDETLTVQLDDEFTPIIIQNGYETLVGNLSGGEKTAVALAYRLALNKVINDIIHEIKTKDLLMLDEPTDGFSSEQLDKMKEVLDELNMNQVIIVSHESKVESFVDNVVHIAKNEHVSFIG